MEIDSSSIKEIEHFRKREIHPLLALEYVVAFDKEVGDAISKYARDGNVELQVERTVVWGRPQG